MIDLNLLETCNDAALLCTSSLRVIVSEPLKIDCKNMFMTTIRRQGNKLLCFKKLRKFKNTSPKYCQLRVDRERMKMKTRHQTRWSELTPCIRVSVMNERIVIYYTLIISQIFQNKYFQNILKKCFLATRSIVMIFAACLFN